MARFFTLDQARSFIPQVEKSLRSAISLKAEHIKADAELKEIVRRIMMTGGSAVNTNQAASLKAAKELTARLLKETFDEFSAIGCLIKDLDIGLVDFPTLYHGKEVYLCWRLGEPSIDFWHGVDEGFRGRKPIDEEFRNNHRGDD